jgi:hypothetical protein
MKAKRRKGGNAGWEALAAVCHAMWLSGCREKDHAPSNTPPEKTAFGVGNERGETRGGESGNWGRETHD